ncbi:MAG TPA: NAD-dependent epimerase/dehydratase family protein [Lentimicrobium sp.]|nr:NAD-dependent epimerase/dehydratase family protein [Lentimicrobium sp.]
MQTILGGGGAIGNELAKALTIYTSEIKIVNRNPVKINDTDMVFKADLLKTDEVDAAVEGSSVVYLTAGLPYNIKYWKTNWPVVMSNVIEACIKANAKLVVFDNMYMYHPSSLDHMSEDAFINPVSEKGKVRMLLNRMLFDAIEKRKLSALIARCADYYGPGEIQTSMIWQTVIKPLKEGKKASWMGSPNYKHSFTYTPDAGKATALLGNTPDAYNQVWHLPTAPDPLTGRQWIEAFAAEFGVKPDFRTAPKSVVRIMGLFMPIMREMVEMIYQYDRDYVFVSNKFEERFGIKPTPYAEGIKMVAK